MALPPTKDPVINEHLESLGKADFTGPPCPQICWEKPVGLPPAFAGFELHFDLDIENPDTADYQRVLDEWERLKQNAELIVVDAKQCAIDLFREVYAEQLWDDQLARYRVNGQLSDRLILDALEPNAINARVSSDGAESYIWFFCKWEDEHGLEFEVDGTTIRRPWRENDCDE
jgi:hypothetical protein